MHSQSTKHIFIVVDDTLEPTIQAGITVLDGSVKLLHKSVSHTRNVNSISSFGDSVHGIVGRCDMRIIQLEVRALALHEPQ